MPASSAAAKRAEGGPIAKHNAAVYLPGAQPVNCRDGQCNSIPTVSLHSRRGIIAALVCTAVLPPGRSVAGTDRYPTGEGDLLATKARGLLIKAPIQRWHSRHWDIETRDGSPLS